MFVRKIQNYASFLAIDPDDSAIHIELTTGTQLISSSKNSPHWRSLRRQVIGCVCQVDGVYCVLGGALFDPEAFLGRGACCWMPVELSRSRSVVSNARMSKHSFSSRRLLSQDHGRLPDKHIAKNSNKTCIHVVDCLVRTAKKRLWARPPVLTPVPSQAIHHSPPIAVGSRRARSPAVV